tara:strand:+ start:1460 stop:2008 length:549 start_codon:yes stop_codon:yes gene_type:complete
MNIVQKLLSIQTELKAPKNQRNKFGNYNYRSAEDILESIKPLAKKYDVAFKITDKICSVGDYHYVESTAKIIDVEDSTQQIESAAQAIIDFDAKGMQHPQRTGAASSYAKKYALGNLLLIDDTKDPDATNDHGKKNDKSLIKPGTETWDKVVNYLENGGSLVEVMKKYKLSPDQLNKLNSVK